MLFAFFYTKSVTADSDVQSLPLAVDMFLLLVVAEEGGLTAHRMIHLPPHAINSSRAGERLLRR